MLWWGSRLSTDQRFEKLEESLARLKRMVEERDLDWVDMRSRCKRLLDRTEKAAHKITAETPTEEPAAETNGEGQSLSQSRGRLLTPHQIEIQQQVLRRRAGA